MRMEFRRLTGKVLWTRDWSVDGPGSADLRMHARDALMGFYDGDQDEFWPKAEFRDKVPEEVTIYDASGRLLAAYDIRNMMADTKRRLSGIRRG